MRVIVCHSKKALVQVARLHAERNGMRVEVARDGNDVLARARADRPDMIILGGDLKNPSTEETKAMLKADPSLSGVNVVVAKGELSDILKSAPGLGWPKIPTPPKW